MKKTYIIPSTEIVNLFQADGILTNLSGGNGTLGNGGTTTSGNVTHSDVKSNDAYNVWDDDWSR